MATPDKIGRLSSFQNFIVGDAAKLWILKRFGVKPFPQRGIHYPADSVWSRAAPSSLSAESEIPIHRALRKGREQANSRLYAPKQSGGLF